MRSDSFCSQFVSDMVNDNNQSEYHDNISYANDKFFSYRMPICRYKKFPDGKHVFYVVDKSESPSRTTTKHMNSLIFAIEKASKNNPDIIIETVTSLREEDL